MVSTAEEFHCPEIVNRIRTKISMLHLHTFVREHLGVDVDTFIEFVALAFHRRSKLNILDIR